MSNVVIIGGHGKVALRLMPLLVEAGHDVTAWIRNPDHGPEIEQLGGQALLADVETLGVDDIAALLQQADVLVWSAGAGGGSPQRTYAVDRDAAIRSMEAATMSDTRRYIMVSYFGAGPDHGVAEDNPFFAYADAKSAADSALAASPLDWTILRPSTLTLDEPTGRIESGPGVEAGQVSRGNVAQAVAVAVDDPASIGKVIAFNDGDTPIEDVLGG